VGPWDGELCCFCKHGIERNETDPCAVTIQLRWHTYRRDAARNPPLQMLWAHLECLERNVNFLEIRELLAAADMDEAV
jgi:hypothetical protein